MDPIAARELVLLLQRFTQASDRYVESTGQLHSTHRTDMNALGAIMRFEAAGTPPTPGDLARELSLSSPATTALLDRLERHGHIERLRMDADRRLVRIRLTDKAKTDGRTMFGPLATHMMAVIAQHEPADLAVVSRFLKEAIEGVDRATAATRADL
ncbi:MarR family winged helix-turn-helix transcriptional regulator [Paeniglutamicibacter cryotolerans]|uniref:DNA-binding MarR family transcriptional regulator n=1 Tax=Paeniglutamicibacter cryotolerans TaxID=670079 RepID=A0A839QQC2_9MICC|nr:MarR family transcriptional regulator [Paeniglutamicibacter cryotolerans]MBB2994281.1 DNA-binding MarR family transcriptional regulator [Paeniglutamicibacter cryotolerans]